MGVLNDKGLREADIPDLLRAAADEFEWARGAGEPESTIYRERAAAKVAKVYGYTCPCEPITATDLLRKE